MSKTPNKAIGSAMKSWMLLLVAVPVVLLMLRSRAQSGQTVQPSELAELLKGKDGIQLIDVRTPEEFAAGHIAGGKLIPLDQLASRITEIDKTKPVVFYCRSGRRSGNALNAVKDAGLIAPRHLEGGILAWASAGLPSTK
jgi:rhodanese-related sulfurtransferase